MQYIYIVDAEYADLPIAACSGYDRARQICEEAFEKNGSMYGTVEKALQYGEYVIYRKPLDEYDEDNEPA